MLWWLPQERSKSTKSLLTRAPMQHVQVWASRSVRVQLQLLKKTRATSLATLALRSRFGRVDGDGDPRARALGGLDPSIRKLSVLAASLAVCMSDLLVSSRLPVRRRGDSDLDPLAVSGTVVSSDSPRFSLAISPSAACSSSQPAAHTRSLHLADLQTLSSEVDPAISP